MDYNETDRLTHTECSIELSFILRITAVQSSYIQRKMHTAYTVAFVSISNYNTSSANPLMKCTFIQIRIASLLPVTV